MKNVTWLNHYTLRESYQYLLIIPLIIPSSLIYLSIIRIAADCDLKFFSYIVLVFLKFKVPLVNTRKQKLIDVWLRIAKKDRKVWVIKAF